MKKRSFWNSIYTRFALRLLLLAFIPVTLVILCFYFLYHQPESKKYELNTQVTNSIVANIENYQQYISRTTHSLLSNSELISFLQNDFSMETDYNTYITSIQNYISAALSNAPQSDIYIYMDNPTIPMGMDVFYHLSDISATTPIHSFLSSDEIELWLCESDFASTDNAFLFPTDSRFIYLCKAYDYNKDFLGLLVFSIPEDILLSFDSNGDSPVISNGHNRIINLTGDDLPESLSFTPKDDNTYFVQQSRYLITWEYPDEFPFTMIVVTRASDYQFLIIGFFFLLCLFALLSMFLCLRSLRQMVKQMNQCLTAMDTSISHNYRTRIPVAGNNEISDISQRINLILNQASELSRQNILKETSNKQSQLIALQHQINPHFIYNTMEVFSSRMKTYGHYEESDAMVAFANIFRYNISTNESLVTIYEEIQQIENYLHIQRLRYPKIFLRNQIDDTLAQARLPKFTLQPIIENSIYHGISDTNQPMVIALYAECRDSMLQIAIMDNGSGIRPEQLETLNRILRSPAPNPKIVSDGHSVGLKNINTRLQLFFGPDSHLTLENLSGHGTCVHFEIPYSNGTPN